MPYAVSLHEMQQDVTKHQVRSGRPHQWPQSITAIVGLTVMFLTGCATSQRYVEKYEIKQLNVVFLDERSLHERWAKIAGQAPIQFATSMNSSTPLIKTVRGFYDYSTNTLYCEKWNYEVCGHELHHAALGQFHPQD
ncbi:MAG: hypothetical protein ABL983_17350 [Nitrospira sp.]